jgi:hypothetical protein
MLLKTTLRERWFGRQRLAGRWQAVCIGALLISAVACQSALPPSTATAPATAVQPSGPAQSVETSGTPVVSSPAQSVDISGIPVVASSPDPLAVAVTADEARSATQTVGTDGGSISVTASDGTAVTLSFPQQSVQVATSITLTPLAALVPQPLSGGYFAGVQIEPAGTFLDTPAVLTLTSDWVQTGDVRSFGFDEGGANFHLYPMSRIGSTATLLIWHFSGYGVGLAAAGDAQNLAGHRPDNATGAFEDQLGMVSTDPSDPEEERRQQEELLCRGYDLVIAGDLAAAQQDDSLVDLAVHEFGVWMKTAIANSLFGCVLPRIDAGLKAADQAYKNATARAEKRCKQQHDISQGYRMLTTEAARQLLGGTSDETVLDRIDSACLTFRFDFDSQMTATGISAEFDMHLTAHITLHPQHANLATRCNGVLVLVTAIPKPPPGMESVLPTIPPDELTKIPPDVRICEGVLVVPNPSTARYNEMGELHYDSVDVSGTPAECTASVNPTGGTLSIIGSILVPLPGTVGQPVISFSVIPAVPPKENFSETCKGITVPALGRFWFDGYTALHYKVHWTFKNWTSSGEGAEYAVDVEHESGRSISAFIEETLELKLIHCPDGKCPVV